MSETILAERPPIATFDPDAPPADGEAEYGAPAIRRQHAVAIPDAAPADAQGQVLAAILAIARDPTVDVAKMQAMMAMQERMEERQAVTAFNRAYHAMEALLPRIKRNGDVEYKNKQTGELEKSFKFARWEDVDSAIREILRQYGFSLSFETKPRQGDGGGMMVTGTLSHVEGHQRQASIGVALDTSGGKNNNQAAGSSLSYGARYTTRMLLNLVTEGEDDDGVAGGEKPTQTAAPPNKLDAFEEAQAQRRAARKETTEGTVKPGRTVGEILVEIGPKLEKAATRDEVDALLDTDEAVKLTQFAKGLGADRWNAMVKTALDRTEPFPGNQE